jgi:hypothetical protein
MITGLVGGGRVLMSILEGYIFARMFEKLVLENVKEGQLKARAQWGKLR